MTFATDHERLSQIWSLVRDLNDDDSHHPHNEAFRAAVLRIQKVCKPVFDPSAEDLVAKLAAENEQLKTRIAGLEAKIERTAKEQANG